MPKCKWVREKDGFRWFFPQCWGGAIHGKKGCYCRSECKDTIEKMEDRIEKLEKRLAKLEGPKPKG